MCVKMCECVRMCINVCGCVCSYRFFVDLCGCMMVSVCRNEYGTVCLDICEYVNVHDCK